MPEVAPQEPTAELDSAIDIDTDDPIVRPVFEAMKERGAGTQHIPRVIARAPSRYQGATARGLYYQISGL